MQNSTGREQQKDRDVAKADSDATSKELARDVEQSEKDADSSGSEIDSGPSPDGAFDESDETKDAGPM